MPLGLRAGIEVEWILPKFGDLFATVGNFIENVERVPDMSADEKLVYKPKQNSDRYVLLFAVSTRRRPSDYRSCISTHRRI